MVFSQCICLPTEQIKKNLKSMRAARGKHKNIPVIHFNAFQHPLQFRMPFGLPLLFLLLLLLLLALLLFYIFNRNSRHTQMCERTHRVTCVALRATSDER